MQPADNFRLESPADDFVYEQPLKLITEETVRDACKKGGKLKVCKDTIYTPLARDAIKELKAESILVCE